MIAFFSDLDNTLIFSYKHDIGKEKRCVEIYQGREVSYITERTYGLLTYAASRLLFVPVTTRTEEQYRRMGRPRPLGRLGDLYWFWELVPTCLFLAFAGTAALLQLLQ